MGRSQETFHKKDVRAKKEKKRKEKLAKKEAKKEAGKAGMDEMIAYVDEFGNITDTPPDPEQLKRDFVAEDIQVSVPKDDEVEAEDKTRIGVVTFFNDSKGFGFIKDSQTQESIFVHINNTLEEIKENNMVSFETEKGPKGLTAIDVKVHKPAPAAPKSEPEKPETPETPKSE